MVGRTGVPHIPPPAWFSPCGILALAVTFVSLGACGTREGNSTEPEISQTPSSAANASGGAENFQPTHGTLSDLVRDANRILLGEVTSKSPGYLIGDPPGELKYDRIEIRVTEVLRGTGISANDIQTFFELSGESKAGASDAAVLSPDVGARGAFFLKEMPAPPARRPPASEPTQWFLSGPQGGFFELPNDRVQPRGADDPFSQAQAAKGWRRLIEEIREEARNAG